MVPRGTRHKFSRQAAPGREVSVYLFLAAVVIVASTVYALFELGAL
ncbi:MAG: hypothetical protein GTO22_14420 [Gemmatimonadales bacterium]|nr:hypothetical protein [Gemmatimonadales bacterium]